MSKEHIIIGCNGQVGKALREIFPEATAVDRDQLDISDNLQVNDFEWTGYSTIINAAAYVNADHAETTEGRELTWRINAVGPRNLAGVALKNNMRLIHFSSEYVFDGTRSNHSEDEPLTPISVYGDAKAAGDLAVSLVPEHYILRTSWVIGDGHNFVKTMKRLADMRIDPKVVNDQYGRLTFASELANAVRHLVEVGAETGTYNVSNSGPIKSWSDIAGDVFEAAGHDRRRVKLITTEEYRRDKVPFAPRPTHSDMDLSKIQKTGFVSRDYEELLRLYVKSLPSAE